MTHEPGGAFTLRFEERGSYPYAFVGGPEDSVSVSKGFWKQIHSKAVELGFRRVLVAESVPNQASTAEMFEIAELVTETFGHGMKVAHVDARASDLDLDAFGETVAVKRGLDARVFASLADAEAWLHE